jgi:polyhydroxybutyrate depolymerase
MTADMKRSARSIRVAGAERNYLLAEPDGTATGLVLSLHGSRSNADRQALLSGLADLAESAGAVVAFPEASLRLGAGYEWDLDGDLEFLAALVSELVEHYHPPHGRAAMTGMSGGARMSCRFAAAAAHMVSMVGAIGGVRAPVEHPARPVPVLAFHGSADRINPYAGTGTGRWVESVPDAVRAWAKANGHPGPPSVVEISPTLTRTTYGQPGGPGEVTLWTSKGAGHTWPGGRMGLLLRFFLGRTSKEIDASREIWSFERAHTADT